MPRAGDGARWEAAFAAGFADEPAIRHRSFAWDRPDGEPGAAAAELTPRGFMLDDNVGLVAAPSELAGHPRANREVEIRAPDPARGRDEAQWEGVIALRLANNAIDQFVIVADAAYHALGIYESLGFVRRERVITALRPPP